MNGRLPISPLPGIRQSQRTAHAADQLPSDWPRAKWEGPKFFRSSCVCDFEREPTRHLNWGTLFGFALSIGISASFWSAAALLFARYSR
jgi:hypothetical protein